MSLLSISELADLQKEFNSSRLYTCSIQRQEPGTVDDYGHITGGQWDNYLPDLPCAYKDQGTNNQGEMYADSTIYTAGRYVIYLDRNQSDIKLTDRVSSILDINNNPVDSTVPFYDIREIVRNLSYQALVLTAAY